MEPSRNSQQRLPYKDQLRIVDNANREIPTVTIREPAFTPKTVAKEALISSAQQFSRQHKDYIRLYFEATRTADREQAALLAREIEGMSARLYTEIVQRAQAAGSVRRDLDPRLFAFFMDNLLMMMQFSYCCPYYQERFKLYGGEDVLEDSELVPSQLLKFLESAFTLEQADIPHNTKTEVTK